MQPIDIEQASAEDLALFIDEVQERLKDEVFNALADTFMIHNHMSEDHACELAARCVEMLRARGALRGA